MLACRLDRAGQRDRIDGMDDGGVDRPQPARLFDQGTKALGIAEYASFEGLHGLFHG